MRARAMRGAGSRAPAVAAAAGLLLGCAPDLRVGDHVSVRDGRCEQGATAACYSGPPETRDVGACASGRQACDATSGLWGACEGEVLPATESCNGNDDDCDNLGGCPGVFQWGKRFGGAGNERVTAIAATPDGGVVLVGSFDQSFTFGASGTELESAAESDIFVARLDPGGALIWQRRFGDPNDGQTARLVSSPTGASR